MIQLKPDHLLFEISSGEQIPCSAEMVAVELMGDAMGMVDPSVVREAAAAVLHYFKEELGRVEVSIHEFSSVLENVLKGLGLDVKSETKSMLKIAETDLRNLTTDAAHTLEMVFFQRLREELHRQLQGAPELVRFSGLRPCVKRLVGTRRWTHQCQELSDQIVEFLRGCLFREASACAMVVC